jgi:Domain of unknown function (DUF5666)
MPKKYFIPLLIILPTLFIGRYVFAVSDISPRTNAQTVHSLSRGRVLRIRGVVTAINTSTITVAENRTQAQTTFAIDSQTRIVPGGRSAEGVLTQDIHVGDMVIIIARPSNTTNTIVAHMIHTIPIHTLKK